MNSADHMPLHFEINGTGAPVIFLHGFMENATMWHDLVKRLPVTAICVDLPGHGKSPDFQDDSISIERAADLVWDLIEANNWQQAQIVGHSMGGYVALELFRKHPEFEHVYLLHSHPWADSESKKLDRNRVIDLVREKAAVFIQEAIPNLFWQKDRLEAIQLYKQAALTMHLKAIAHAAQAMRDRRDNTHLVLQNKDRFTFIQGRYDSLIPKMDVLSFCLTNSVNYIELSHSGHMGQVEELETLSAILSELLTI